MRQVACVGKTGEYVFARQSWIVGQKIILGLTRGQKFENEFNRQACAADDGLSGEHFGVGFNSLAPIHSLMLSAGERTKSTST